MDASALQAKRRRERRDFLRAVALLSVGGFVVSLFAWCAVRDGRDPTTFAFAVAAPAIACVGFVA